MRIVSVRTLVLVPLWMAIASFAQDAQAGRYFYQEYYQPPVVVQGGSAYYVPTTAPYVPVAGPARGVVVQPVQGVVTQPGPAAVLQSAPVAVQPAPGYVAPRKIVNRGLFWKTKEVVTGPPGHEEYQYHVHRFLAPNYHYTVRNDDGVVRTWGRRSW